jgi:hypothetical protein
MARRSGKANGIINFGFEVNPSPQKLGEAFNAASKSLKDYRPAFRLLTPIMAAGFKKAIDTKGASIGRAWTQSTDAYLRRKARNGFGRADFVLTGLLTRTISSPSGVMLSLGTRAARFGTRLHQARALQFGLGRWFVDISNDMSNAIADVLSNHVRGMLRQIVDMVNGASKGVANG